MKKIFILLVSLSFLIILSGGVSAQSFVKEKDGALFKDDFNRPDNADVNSGLPIPLWSTIYTFDAGGTHSVEISDNKLRLYATGGSRLDPDNELCSPPHRGCSNGDWPVVSSLPSFSDGVLEYDITIQTIGGGDSAHHEEFITYFRMNGEDRYININSY